MNKKTKITIIFTLCALLLMIAGSALAAGGYQIGWWTVDSGGGSSQSAGGQYALSGTIGQHDAGHAEGGDYSINSGFWVRRILDMLNFVIHLPLVLK